MTKAVELSLEGARVLVTAGAGGIGRAIAETFAGAGARMHICDIAEEALLACSAEHPDWGATICNVADESDVNGLFEQVQSNLGGLDILINNAGIAGPTAGVDEITPDDWRETIDINLNGQFYCARLAVPMLRQSDNASIVCISSVAGRLGYAYRTPYSASKWAVVGFAKSLAKELGPDGIRVNAILPGVVEGPRIDRVISARAETMGRSFEDMKKSMLSKVSLRTMVTGQDVANQALYLCSDLGRTMSGQAISVCGNVETI